MISPTFSYTLKRKDDIIMTMKLIDWHCDTISLCADTKQPLRSNDYHIDLQKMQKAGASLQVFAIFTPTNEIAKEEHITETAVEYYDRVYQYYLNELQKNCDIIAPIYSYEDYLHNEKCHKISSLLGMEDGVVIGDSIDELKRRYEQGLRLITLTWNYENYIGYPNHSDSTLMKRGLKLFGKEVVEAMNELGMLVDVSHLSEGGFYDVASISKKPFIASHSCARELYNHQRNLTDHQLKTLGNSGGIVGVNYFSLFLTGNEKMAYIKDVVAHARHIANKAGIESVCLGSDYDGISCDLEWKNYAGTPLIVEALSKEFSSSELEKICYKNGQRIIKECL